MKFAVVFGNKILLLFFISVVLGIIVGVVEILFGFSFQNFLSAFHLIPSGEIHFSYLPFTEYPTKLFVGIAFTQFVVNFLSSVIPSIAFEAFNTRVRRIITQRTIGTSDDADIFSVAKVSHIFSNVVPKVATFVSAAILFMSTIITMMTLVFGMGQISWLLTGFILGILTLFNFPLLFFKGSFQRYATEIHSLTMEFTQSIIKDLRNLYFLRIVGTINMEIKKLFDTNNAIFKNYLRYITSFYVNSGWPIFSGVLIIITLVFINEDRHFIGSASIVPFLYILTRFSMNISKMVASFTQMRLGYPFLYELIGYVEYFHVSKLHTAPEYRIYQELRKEIPRKLIVHDLSIGRKKPYLEHITFFMKEGDFLLISGKSGRGKTTLLMTLIGLISRLDGKILWNDCSIDEIDTDFLKQHVGYSGPDPFLLDATIEANLLYGAINREREQSRIKQMLEIAQAQFVYNFPEGLKHMLGEGGEGISAGQKQRLSIARSLLRNPQVLLLDEATANIDEPTEAAIFTAIRNVFHNIIIIVVSHRTSLKKFATNTIALP